MGGTELGRLAQTFHADYAEEDYSSLPRRLANAHVRVVARVERKADESPYGACGDKQHTLGRMIRLDTSSPYTNAHARLRKWKRAGGLA
ncbi:ClbS/DfsB family four-helix bundle protein [Burkholderia pseudomallei]|uniref:ClbS/DfsB family four-helix bundle protein n=1 Tax=Burkholderia pseudomallei TaxID=28450 RepID=UPI0018A1ED54|nr:ClbS/DfsB family four-helix bundle protein [Burkholderia pseudomallei]MDY7862139.1 ClbS/DfsB family four-helix bundle protein [Burkholderia pseudomallei]